MEGDIQEYANSLRMRVGRLEQTAQRVRHKQKESSRRELVMTKSFHTEIEKLGQELSDLDKELHSLALDVKRFIKTFQGLGFQAQFSTLQDRVDMIKFGQWMSRREFDRILKEMEN